MLIKKRNMWTIIEIKQNVEFIIMKNKKDPDENMSSKSTIWAKNLNFFFKKKHSLENEEKLCKETIENKIKFGFLYWDKDGMKNKWWVDREGEEVYQEIKEVWREREGERESSWYRERERERERVVGIERERDTRHK
jgi:hypothetical protein